MVALHTLVATLAAFNARRLFEFSVSLLNVPTHGARLLCVGRGQLSRRIRDNILRALGRKRQAEQAQIKPFRKLVQMHALAVLGFGIAPTQLGEGLMNFAVIADQAVRFEQAEEDLVRCVELQHQGFEAYQLSIRTVRNAKRLCLMA